MPWTRLRTPAVCAVSHEAGALTKAAIATVCAAGFCLKSKVRPLSSRTRWVCGRDCASADTARSAAVRHTANSTATSPAALAARVAINTHLPRLLATGSQPLEALLRLVVGIICIQCGCISGNCVMRPALAFVHLAQLHIYLAVNRLVR